LSDTGALNLTGPVTASAVTIGGTAGSTPGTITADGSIGATNTLSLTSGAGGITLNNGAALTGQTVDLDSGTGGISLIGNALVGQANAVVDLTAGAAGVTEFNSSTIVAATLQGNVAGPVQLGNDNTVLTLGSFTVTGAGKAFELRDTGTLAVTGPLTATGDVSLNAIGTGSGNAITITGIVSSGGTLSAGSGLGALALQTGAVLTAPTIALQSDGITLTGNASVGEAGAVVELGSFGGFITEAGTSIITAATLETTTLGSAGAVSLLGTRNAIGTLGTFTIFGSSGDGLTLIDSIPLTVSGPVTANNPPFSSQNVVLEASQSITVDGPITASGDIILATGGAGPITPPPATEAPLITVQGATVTSTGGSVSLLAGPGGTVQLGGATVSGSLVAGSGQLVTLQMDTLSVAGPASSITAPGGTIEIAPATPGNAIDFATAASNTLTIPASAIAVMSAGTLRLGAVTINGTETTTAGAIAVDAAVDLTGHATTLQLLATGPITEPGGPLTVNTLAADGTAITLLNANNAIGNLGPLSASAGNIEVAASSALTIAGLVDAAAGNVYLETSNAGGITFGAFTVEPVAGGTVGLQTNALANLGTAGATGVVNTGATGTFELSPNTASPVTLGTAGGGLSLTNLTGITAGLVRIGAVTQPGNTSPTIIASSITIGADFNAAGVALELDATGEVAEAPGASLTAASLTGTATAFQLPTAGNAIGTINDLDATAGNITVVDGENLELTGTQNGNNLFYEVATAGGTLSLGTGKIAAQLTAATGGRISLVADNINEAFDSVVTATGGTVELAPVSAINASLQGSNGLVIDQRLLTEISTGPTGTLVIGGFTDVPNGGTTPTPRASSITVDTATTIAGT
ncbi:MAG TPA: hypothetical protein VJK90_13120, partial [Acetobacteraceae bacterium]|nr:hypothetical protein [Acetobacteraceae bacterium]